MTFKDHFSGHSGQYADFRPGYPEDLYKFIFSLCKQHELAWDCACGNGQASFDLAKGFRKLVASDASAQQVEQARLQSQSRFVQGLSFECFKAEEAPFSDHSVDLVTVAQALHWFDLEMFFSTCKRVLKPGAPLVVWTYGLSTIESETEPKIDELSLGFYQALDAYWPPERKLVEQAYQSIEFPFSSVTRSRGFEISQQWTLEQFIGYLESWSSWQRYLGEAGSDKADKNLLEILEQELCRYWRRGETKQVVWPLTVIYSHD